MEWLYSAESVWLWAIALTAALFYPVRQLVWVIYVRRAERDGKRDEARRQALRMRATVTSVLLCGIFSILYTAHLFSRPS